MADSRHCISPSLPPDTRRASKYLPSIFFKQLPFEQTVIGTIVDILNTRDIKEPTKVILCQTSIQKPRGTYLLLKVIEVHPQKAFYVMASKVITNKTNIKISIVEHGTLIDLELIE